MPREQKDVEAGLEQKGFLRDERHHHYFIYETMAGKKTAVRTRTSHGSHKTLGDPLLAQMAKQCRLRKKEFLALIDCPMDRENYESLL